PILQARSGIERAQGGLEMPPVFLVPPVTDNTAAMLNALGILLALYHRERTGEGLWVETSLLAAAALLQSDSLTAYAGR
ncbi:MAG: CoA transferase, partial [Chloroflexota bacterium]